MATEHNNYETVGYVLKKHRFLLSAIAVLLLLSIGASYMCLTVNRSRHKAGQPADLALKPVEMLSRGDVAGAGAVLTETTPVGQDYFADAMFIGDSLTDGIRIYDEFGEVTAVSLLGISTHAALTETFYELDGKRVTMADAVSYYKPRKLYIMLGTNGINYQTIEWNLEGYAVLIDEFQSRVPGCAIVIQALPPATAATAAARPSYSVENIAKYNAGLLDIAMKKGVYYLDVHAALCDENGYLRADIAGSDGIHMLPAGYRLWYDYIIRHAVKGESAFCLDENGMIRFVDRHAHDQQESEPDAPEDAVDSEEPKEAEGTDQPHTE